MITYRIVYYPKNCQGNSKKKFRYNYRYRNGSLRLILNRQYLFLDRPMSIMDKLKQFLFLDHVNTYQ